MESPSRTDISGIGFPSSYYRGFPSCASGREPTCQCRRCKRCRFSPWVRRIPQRKAQQPTPGFLPGESHGQRSLVGYSPWGCRELDTTEVSEHAHTSYYKAEALILAGILRTATRRLVHPPLSLSPSSILLKCTHISPPPARGETEEVTFFLRRLLNRQDSGRTGRNWFGGGTGEERRKRCSTHDELFPEPATSFLIFTGVHTGSSSQCDQHLLMLTVNKSVCPQCREARLGIGCSLCP